MKIIGEGVVEWIKKRSALRRGSLIKGYQPEPSDEPIMDPPKGGSGVIRPYKNIIICHCCGVEIGDIHKNGCKWSRCTKRKDKGIRINAP